jgi:hypothetical protein
MVYGELSYEVAGVYWKCSCGVNQDVQMMMRADEPWNLSAVFASFSVPIVAAYQSSEVPD